MSTIYQTSGLQGPPSQKRVARRGNGDRVLGRSEVGDDLSAMLQSFLTEMSNRSGGGPPVGERLERMEEAILRLETVLNEVRTALGERASIKDSYSTAEVAKLLGKRPFTVREWCRLGRVRAEKTYSGRGAEPEWRLSHDEVVRVRNEGLLPLPTRWSG